MPPEAVDTAKLPAELAPHILDDLDAGGTRARAGGLEDYEPLPL